jgi:uncharacterized protein YjbI with pentapeptide repeats
MQERNASMRWARVVFAAVLTGLSAELAFSQTPGDNVNMVAGTSWPGGDPFLQRQNEPSLAVSSRNPLHLLAGANDYRSVDLPATDAVPGGLAADAWLGLFKSFDGGLTWQSTLLPGFPQDGSPEGMASPLRAYRTAADPTVRAGTHGLFYYSGIAFNRGTNNGAIFVTSLLDQNNKENGSVPGATDPIRYLSTVVVDTGTSGQFLDKPWIAVDVPRQGAGPCTLPVGTGETIPAGNVYLVWSRFTGSQSTKIMFSRSLDCGRTWSNPIKLSESNSVNQGTVLAVDPSSGEVYVAWRRFAASSESDAVLFAKSVDFGRSFAKAQTLASIVPFDQTTTQGSFRTSALPTLNVSVDRSGQSRIHVAWAGRHEPDPDNPTLRYSRILISSSADRGATWSAPTPVDGGPIQDDRGGSFTRGHQFMPQLTFAAGKLMLLYYDQRLDHTVGHFYPREPFSSVADGKFYEEERAPRGELPDQPGQVFKDSITDAGLALRRHTIDLRVAQADAGPSLDFGSVPVSRYKFGTRGDESGVVSFLQQLQVNPPNLPLFQQGTVPFFGDYIDIAGQSFLPPELPGGAWRFNVAPSSTPVFHAVWTSNQDVRPPADGNWANYTPVGGGGPSVYDPTQTTPQCVPGQEGMRNQNIYTSRITQGLLVTSPQNAKPLWRDKDRAFVVQVQNATAVDRVFRLRITSPAPPGGSASFIPSSAPTPPESSGTCGFPCSSLDVEIAARSSIARPVFARSTDPAASIVVAVQEIPSVGGEPLIDGLSQSVALNPEGSVTNLAQPDGSGDDISVFEVYNPFITSANVANANVANANVANANVSNANVANANVANANVANAHVANPDLADANVANANVANANVANANVANANVANANVSNVPVSDATYTITNTGNTTHSYHVKLVGQEPDPGVQLQLIINKTYTTPLALSCSLQQEPQNALIANIVSPEVSAPGSAADPNLSDPRISNATLALAPGETAAVTLRGTVDPATMKAVANRVWPRAIAHAGDGTIYSDPLVASTDSRALPPLVLGVPYSANLTASGGKPPYTWTLASGSLPPALQLGPTGTISGTPDAVGTFTAEVQVTDSSIPPQSATQVLSLSVSARPSATEVMVASSAVVGQSVMVTAEVRDAAPGQTSSPTGSVTFASSNSSDAFAPGPACTLAPISASASRCSVTLPPSGTGTRTLSAQYSGSGVHAPSSGGASLVVGQAATITKITADTPDPSIVGSAVAITFVVAAAPPGSGIPTGTVAVTDGVVSCSAMLASGSGACNLPLSTLGLRALVASYAGDSQFSGSVSLPASHQVDAPPPPPMYGFAGFFTPLSAAGTAASPTYSGAFQLGRGVPIKWRLTDASGQLVQRLSSTTLLRAVFNGSSKTCKGSASGSATVPLFSPTSGATGGSTFRYDATGSQFIFNWDTSTGVPTGPGCYTILLGLDDGSPERATWITLR